MSDNVGYTPGAGATVAADEISGALHQRIKITVGADGVNDGDVSLANPLPVTGTIAITGVATAAKQDTSNAALGTPADAEAAADGTIIAILKKLRTLLTNPLAVTGTFFQATQPVSAASLPLPAGAATAALQTQPGVDIGDVTVNNGAGASAVNVQDGGNSITVDGSVTANAGTNLNTSLLALESGGNLATIAGKDFATQTTLALIKAKTDNLDVTLSGGGTHVIVDSMPAAASAATATEDIPEYTEAQSAALSQDLEGNLRTRVSAVVSEAVPVYIDGEVQSLSINSQGRLRVSAVSAPVYMEFFLPFDFGSNADIRELSTSPWRALS